MLEHEFRIYGTKAYFTSKGISLHYTHRIATKLIPFLALPEKAVLAEISPKWTYIIMDTQISGDSLSYTETMEKAEKTLDKCKLACKLALRHAQRDYLGCEITHLQLSTVG